MLKNCLQAGLQFSKSLTFIFEASYGACLRMDGSNWILAVRALRAFVNLIFHNCKEGRSSQSTKKTRQQHAMIQMIWPQLTGHFGFQLFSVLEVWGLTVGQLESTCDLF